MKINIDIDDELLATAQEVSCISDKNILVENALRLFIAMESQKAILALRGKVQMYDDAV